METNKIKQWFSILSFAVAVVIGFIALFIPPTGIIDASVLWFIAQLLVFTSTMIGVPLTIDNLRQKISNKEDKEGN